MNPLNRRVIVGLFAVALVAAACGGGSGAASGGNHPKPPARGFNSANDTTVVSWSDNIDGPRIFNPLPLGKSTGMPGFSCPQNYPYLLNQKYNTNTSFRMDLNGAEFTNWNWGFDASVQLGKSQPVDPNKYGPGHVVLTGMASSDWTGANSATQWVGSPSKWTLNLHCTSDINKGIITSG
jgi:hypothetical protein